MTQSPTMDEQQIRKLIFISLCRWHQVDNEDHQSSWEEAEFADLMLKEIHVTITQAQTAAHEQGRIVEAKTCERARLHDTKTAKQEAVAAIETLLPDDSIVTSKYGYHSDEKKYGFNIAITEVKSVLKDYKEKEGLA